MAAAPPLDGITVVDLSQIYNGPYATLLLALAGARVIKVEPLHGENLRGRTNVDGAGAPFVMINSCKEGVRLNLKDERGTDLLLRLVERADVLVENFRPGVMERLGLGEEVLRAANPNIIIASGSGFGSTGPYRDYPAMDLTVQAMSGVMSVTGYPDQLPVKAGPAICDFFGGIHLYGAIMTALLDRERTGRARTVEVSMFESVYPSLLSALGLYYGSDGAAVTRTGNRHSGLAEAPYNAYPTSDGSVTLICVTEEHWRQLTEEMGRPELAVDPRFATRRSRVEHMDEVDRIVGGWVAGEEKEALCTRLRARGIPCAPVRDLADVANDEHLIARGMLHEIDHPEVGRLRIPQTPLRLGDDAVVPLRPSPALGEHTHEVFGDWLGIDDATLAELEREGVI
jgi:crotonobetainyl-CoA:carnitine CoA-transferase CaiB-like acyl-CoA transferase